MLCQVLYLVLLFYSLYTKSKNPVCVTVHIRITYHPPVEHAPSFKHWACVRSTSRDQRSSHSICYAFRLINRQSFFYGGANKVTFLERVEIYYKLSTYPLLQTADIYPLKNATLLFPTIGKTFYLTLL